MPPVALPSAAFSCAAHQSYGLLTRGMLSFDAFYNRIGASGGLMLKEVMLGSGGIMLAAAIFASSVAPGTNPAPAATANEPPVVIAPVVTAPPQVAATPPAPIFPEESGDMAFGAPMIETTPVDSGPANDAAAIISSETGEPIVSRQNYNGSPRYNVPNH